MLVAVAAVEAAAMVPFRYLAMEDAAPNIASAHIIATYPGPYRNYYELDLFPKFDMLWQLLLSAFVRIMPALVAERLLVVLLVLALPIAGWYAARGVRPDGGPAAFLLLPLAIGHFQHAAYDSFCLGLVLFFVTIGWWLRHRDDDSAKRYIVLGVLLFFTYLAHMVTLAMAVGLLGVVTVWELLTRGDEGHGRRRLFTLAAATAPIVVLVLAYLSRRESVSGVLRIGPFQLVRDLITMRPAIASLDHREVWPSLLVGLTVIALAVYTLWRFSPRRLRDPRHAWLVATVAAVVVYFVAPDSIGDGGQISARLLLIIVMTAVLWFAGFTYDRRVLAAIVALPIIAAGTLTALHVPKYRAFDRDIQEITDFGDQMPRGSTALALIFVQAQDDVPGFATSEWTGPVFQSIGYLVAERDIVDLSHFNAGLSYFVTQYRDDVNPFDFIGYGKNWLADSPPHVDLLNYDTATGGKGHIDYVITWGEDQAPDNVRANPDYASVRSQLGAGYELVATSSRGHAKLYRHR
jgi:hypothetical protein